MMHFSKKMQGTISVFLILILLPMFVLTAVLIDGTIILGAKNTINDAGELAMGGALAHYDEKLLDYYGLISLDSKVDINSKGKAYFSNTLSSESASTYLGFSVGGGSFIKMKDNDTVLSTVDQTEIWRPYVMESEMLQFMKYRAPVILLNSGILESLKGFEDVKSQTECIKKQLDFEDEVADIQDLLNDLHEKLKDGYVDPSYPSKYKDSYITGSWQDDMHNKFKKLTGYYVARRGIEAHNAPGEASFEDSVSAAKAAVKIAEKIDSNPYNFDYINSFRDAKFYVIDTDFTADLEEGTPEYEEMAQLKEDYDAACEKAEYAKDGLYESLDDYEKDAQKCSDYYTETQDLKELFEYSEKKCKEIKDKIKSAQDEYDEWGEAIESVHNADNKAQMNELRDKWKELFNDLKGSESSLDALKNELESSKNYMDDMLKCMDNMKFCDISYPAHKKNNNWGTISSKADSFTVETKDDYNSACNSINNTFTYTDFSSVAGKKLYDVKNDEFYQKMDGDFCREVEKKVDESEAKGNCKKIQEQQQKQEEEKKNAEKALNQRLKESIADKDIPSNHENVASTSVNTGNDSGKGDLASVSDPAQDKKKAKDAGVKMLDGTGDIQKNLSAGALGIINGGVRSVYESAYEATYVMEMLSDRTSGLGDDEAVSLKGKDMKNNYLYQGEAEYILWGDKTPIRDVTYNEVTIFTIRFALNTISAFTNSRLRHEAETVASGLGAIFPLSIPLITSAIILACSLAETATDINYLVAKGEKVVLMHTQDTWCCYPFTPIGGDYDKRKNTSLPKLDYSDYTWLFLFATMLGDGALSENKLLRTADCIQLNMTESVTGIDGNSIMDEFTMVRMNSSVDLTTYFLRNAAEYVGQKSPTDEKGKITIKYNSAQGY